MKVLYFAAALESHWRDSLLQAAAAAIHVERVVRIGPDGDGDIMPPQIMAIAVEATTDTAVSRSS